VMCNKVTSWEAGSCVMKVTSWEAGSGVIKVTSWEAGSCVMKVRKTEQVDFEPVFESLVSWEHFLWQLGFHSKSWGKIAEGTPTKVSCYSWSTEQLLTGRAQGSRGLIRI